MLGNFLNVLSITEGFFGSLNKKHTHSKSKKHSRKTVGIHDNDKVLKEESPRKTISIVYDYNVYDIELLNKIPVSKNKKIFFYDKTELLNFLKEIIENYGLINFSTSKETVKRNLNSETKKLKSKIDESISLFIKLDLNELNIFYFKKENNYIGKLIAEAVLKSYNTGAIEEFISSLIQDCPEKLNLLLKSIFIVFNEETLEKLITIVMESQNKDIIGDFIENFVESPEYFPYFIKYFFKNKFDNYKNNILMLSIVLKEGNEENIRHMISIFFNNSSVKSYQFIIKDLIYLLKSSNNAKNLDIFINYFLKNELNHNDIINIMVEFESKKFIEVILHVIDKKYSKKILVAILNYNDNPKDIKKSLYIKELITRTVEKSIVENNLKELFDFDQLLEYLIKKGYHDVIYTIARKNIKNAEEILKFLFEKEEISSLEHFIDFVDLFAGEEEKENVSNLTKIIFEFVLKDEKSLSFLKKINNISIFRLIDFALQCKDDKFKERIVEKIIYDYQFALVFKQGLEDHKKRNKDIVNVADKTFYMLLEKLLYYDKNPNSLLNNLTIVKGDKRASVSQ